MIGLVDRTLSLLFLRPEDRTQPSQRFLGDDQARGDSGLGPSDQAVPAELLVFRAIGVEDPLLNVAGKTQRTRGSVDDGLLDGLCVFLEDGKALIHLGQTAVDQGICLLDKRGDVGIRAGEVRQERLREALIALVGILEGFGAVFVVLERCDGVRDDGV